LNVRRPKKKSNTLNEKRIKSCLSRFDSGAYSRLQFLPVVCHSVGPHTEESLQPRADSSSSSEDEDVASQPPMPASSKNTITVHVIRLSEEEEEDEYFA